MRAAGRYLRQQFFAHKCDPPFITFQMTGHALQARRCASWMNGAKSIAVDHALQDRPDRQPLQQGCAYGTLEAELRAAAIDGVNGPSR
jgi:hypothetical protein